MKERFCLKKRQTNYPEVSVMSAARMFTICRREESVSPFIRLYSLTIRSPPGLLAQIQPTVTGQSRVQKKYSLNHCEQFPKRCSHKLTYMFGIFIPLLPFSGRVPILIQDDGITRVTGYNVKDDRIIRATGWTIQRWIGYINLWIGRQSWPLEKARWSCLLGI